MPRNLYVVVLIFYILCPLYVSAQTFSVITSNIRYDNPDDGINNWHYRKQALADKLIQTQAAFIGVQEALLHQLTYIDSVLQPYQYIGVGRDDGKYAGEFAALLYDTTQFSLIKHNTIWLSATPNTISVGWDAALPRICTYGLFESVTTGKSIWVLNTHFDHIGALAKAESAKLILHLLDSMNTAKYPVVVLGDFNSVESEIPIQILLTQLSDAKSIAETPFTGSIGTFNAFDTVHAAGKRIDYIFTQLLKVKNYTVIATKTNNGLWLSDHFPVLVNLEF